MKIVADIDIPYLELFFGPHAELIRLPGREITNAALKNVDGLLVRSITTIDESLLNNTTIKWVGSLTAGTDHLDENWLNSHHIAWRACAGFNAPPVADYIISTLASLIQQGHLSANKKRAAIIGVGAVGSRVAKHLNTLNFDIIYCDPLRAESEPDFMSTLLTDIGDVDLICIHTPLTKIGKHATYHLINADFMTKQKPGCILLNAARGAVVDTNALLTHGKHLIVCLDVFEHEPTINLEVLHTTCIATPHIAGHTIESKWRGIQSLYQWAIDNRWLTKTNITPTIQPATFTIPEKYAAWYTIVEYIFDVMQISNEMKTLLSNPETVGALFDQVRKQHGSRHEFTNIQLQNIDHVPHLDQTILRKLGFISHLQM